MEALDDRLRLAAEVLIEDQRNVPSVGDMIRKLFGGELPSEDMTDRILSMTAMIYEIQVKNAVACIAADADPTMDARSVIEAAHVMALGCVFWQGCAVGKQLGIGDGAEFASQFDLTDNDLTTEKD